MLNLPVHAVFLGITNRRKEGTYFSVPPVRRTHNVLAEGGLAEGDTGGGKIIYTSLLSWKLVDCCCSTTSVQLPNTRTPCVPFACTKRNASPLMKGDKVRGLLNVLSGVFSRQQALVASVAIMALSICCKSGRLSKGMRQGYADEREVKRIARAAFSPPLRGGGNITQPLCPDKHRRDISPCQGEKKIWFVLFLA
jgi:hypothetical protein